MIVGRGRNVKTTCDRVKIVINPSMETVFMNSWRWVSQFCNAYHREDCEVEDFVQAKSRQWLIPKKKSEGSVWGLILSSGIAVRFNIYHVHSKQRSFAVSVFQDALRCIQKPARIEIQREREREREREWENCRWANNCLNFSIQYMQLSLVRTVFVNTS